MKTLIVFISLLSSMMVYGQSVQFGGIYSFGESSEKPNGGIYLYPSSDSTLIFYLELSRGAPSYNSGALVGELIMTSGRTTGKFKIQDTSVFLNCELSFSFYADTLIIETLEESSSCGYGYGVFSDGTYLRRTFDIPESFFDREGNEIFFKDIDIKSWYE